MPEQFHRLFNTPALSGVFYFCAWRRLEMLSGRGRLKLERAILAYLMAGVARPGLSLNKPGGRAGSGRQSDRPVPPHR